MTESIPIEPIDPVASWMGGKVQLAPIICPLIDSIPHTLYAEPFIGMGGIFFRRCRKPKAEFINDRSRDVVNLFRILSRHFPQFCDVLKWQITSRAEFERLRASNPETLTDLERAARFLYLQKTAFGGKVTGQNFGVTYDGGARFNLTKLVPMLEDVHERLSSVVIDNLNYDDFIKRYDYEEALFYLDPPYYGCEDDYGKNMFSPADFEILADLLKSIKGRFILSINDCEPIRDIFKGFEKQEVNLT